MSAATALLRVAPVATSAELMEPESVRHCEMLERGGFKPLPGKVIPVCVDHEKDRVIGQVASTFYNECWTGGTWLFALAHLDEVPDWLERDRAVSISHATTFRRAMPGGWELLTRGLITEISVLSPGVKPAHPLARVVTLTRSPAAVVPSDRSVAGEVIHHSYAPRARASRKLLFSDAEISRRIALAGDTGIPGAIEREVEHMQALEDEYQRWAA